MGRRKKFFEGIPKETYRTINGERRRVWVTKLPSGYEKIVPFYQNDRPRLSQIDAENIILGRQYTEKKLSQERKKKVASGAGKVAKTAISLAPMAIALKGMK